MFKNKRLHITILFALMFILLFSFNTSAASLAKVKNVTTSSYKDTFTFKWPKVTGASGYEIQKVTSSGSLIAKKDCTTNTVSVSNCSMNKYYYFVIRAFKKTTKKIPIETAPVVTEGEGGDSVPPEPTEPAYITKTTKTYGPKSAIIKVKSVSAIGAPSSLKLESQWDCSAKLSWGKVSNSAGYVIEYLNTKTNAYVPLKTVTGYSTTTANLTKLTGNTTYTFRVRAFKKSGSHSYLGAPSKTLKVNVVKFSEDLRQIRNAYYVAKTKAKTTCTNTKTKKTITLKAGQVLYTTARTAKVVSGFLKDGTPIRILSSKLTFTGLDSNTNPKVDYTVKAKEQFVNFKGFASRTSRMIWVSQHMLKVNVFKGSKGNWKLEKAFPCCVGKYSSRTAAGKHVILKSIYYGDYNAPQIWFSSGIAKGGTPDNPLGCAFHNQVDSNMSKAVSNGCVRLYRNDLIWLYNNCPVGTLVYVF